MSTAVRNDQEHHAQWAHHDPKLYWAGKPIECLATEDLHSLAFLIQRGQARGMKLLEQIVAELKDRVGERPSKELERLERLTALSRQHQKPIGDPPVEKPASWEDLWRDEGVSTYG